MLVGVVVFVFFFKQNTAYEMRISDWSSDVCSSDLGRTKKEPHAEERRQARLEARALVQASALAFGLVPARRSVVAGVLRLGLALGGLLRRLLGGLFGLFRGGRSEEHTSELQSLMRISYAVFCLKKKRNSKNNNTNNNTYQKQQHLNSQRQLNHIQH